MLHHIAGLLCGNLSMTRPVTQTLNVSLLLALTSDEKNSRIASDLRHMMLMLRHCNVQANFPQYFQTLFSGIGSASGSFQA